MAAALIVVIAIIAFAAVQLIVLFGGGQQVQRATDSGNLSAANTALIGVNVQLPAPSGDTTNQAQFAGCADPSPANPSGQVNLRNINRVMGQALLVNYNAYVINAAGQDNGAAADALATTTAANNLCSTLYTSLQTSPNLQSSFSNTSNAQPTVQFGKNYLSPSSSPTFSYVNRQTASNVFLSPQQIADYNFTSNTSTLYNTTLSGDVTNVSSDPAHGNYIKGYMDGLKPTNGNSNFVDVHFVPLKPGDKSHLVSAGQFNQNQTPNVGVGVPTFNWSSAVPNTLAISSTDKATDGGYTGGFNAFAICGPVAPVGFAAAIPHGFLRITNGPSSNISGSAGSGSPSSDVFVYVMDNPQYYPVDVSGTIDPYFTSNVANLGSIATTATTYRAYLAAEAAYQIQVNNYSVALQNYNNLMAQNPPPNPPPTAPTPPVNPDPTAPPMPDCSSLYSGSTNRGDGIGANAVTQTNCNNIASVGNGGAPITNLNLDAQGSTPNSDMTPYGGSDGRYLYARPPLIAAYGITAPTLVPATSSVNVADMLNLAMLSARSTGNDYCPVTGASSYQSGVAALPATRAPLATGSFRVANANGALIGSDQSVGIPANGTIANFIQQRLYEIDPNWTSYTTLNQLLDSTYIPMGGVAFIYFSPTSHQIVLNVSATALADAPWLTNYQYQAPDGKVPTNPTDVTQVAIADDTMIDQDSDWNFPHPFDDEPASGLCEANWYAVTPSSGFNNLLGQISMGAIMTNCNHTCTTVTPYTLNAAGTAIDTTSYASTVCPCSGTSCCYGGPC